MVLTLTLLGCMKPSLPLQSGTPREVNVLGVLDAVCDCAAVDTPSAFDAEMTDVVRAHGLTPRLLEGEETMRAMNVDRETTQRGVGLMVVTGVVPLLLVETAPVYFSELNGQYRWTVGVALTFSDGESFRQATFEVPVFLQYHHQREADAVDASAPVVTRRVGELLDAWLASPG